MDLATLTLGAIVCFNATVPEETNHIARGQVIMIRESTVRLAPMDGAGTYEGRFIYFDLTPGLVFACPAPTG